MPVKKPSLFIVAAEAASGSEVGRERRLDDSYISFVAKAIQELVDGGELAVVGGRIVVGSERIS